MPLVRHQNKKKHDFCKLISKSCWLEIGHSYLELIIIHFNKIFCFLELILQQVQPLTAIRHKIWSLSCKFSCRRKMCFQETTSKISCQSEISNTKIDKLKLNIALLAVEPVHRILSHILKRGRIASVNEKKIFFFSSQFSINVPWPIFFLSVSCKRRSEIIKT